MLKELSTDKESGLMGYRLCFSGRIIMVIQYWRSTERLTAYAAAPDKLHRPAWARFFKQAYKGEAVGIWHETYPVSSHETVYVNMPPFGLGKAGRWSRRGSPPPPGSPPTRRRSDVGMGKPSKRLP